MTFLLSLLLQAVGEAISYLLMGLIELFSQGIGLDGEMTLASFFTLFTFCRASYQVFMAAAYFILFTICVFQLFKSFFGPLAEAESPIALVAKTIFFTILVTFSERICQFIINIGTIPYKILDSYELFLEAEGLKWSSLLAGASEINLDASEIATGVGAAGLVGGTTVAAGSVLGGGQLLLLLIIIFLLLILKEFFKLFLEIIERYVILGLLTTVAPLCIATGASKATSQVFRSFIKMYISQIVVMCFSIFFLKAFTLAFGTWLGNMASPEYTFRGQNFTGANFFVQGLMVLAWLKLGQKVDAHMGQLGLNVAQAGGMADTFMSGITAGLGQNSAASMISNKLSNKLAGTNFNRATRGSENAWNAAMSGRLSKQAAKLDAMNPNRPGATTTNKQRSLAAKQLQQMGANKQGLASNDFNKALMANNKSGGSAETGGVAVGNSLKEALGIGNRDDIKALEGSYMGNGKGHLEYEKNGVKGSVDFDLNPSSNQDVLGTIQGQGALAGVPIAITGGNNELKNELTGTDKPIGPSTAVHNADISEQACTGQVLKENDTTSAKTLEGAQNWGEPPKREDFPEGDAGQKEYEEALKQYNESNEHPMIAPDGKIYENGATVGENGEVIGNEMKLEDSAGNAVNANELARFDKDGNEITKDSEKFKNEDGSFNEAAYNKAYAEGSLTDKNGNMMTADGHNPVGIVDPQGNGEAYAKNISDAGNFAADDKGNIAKAADGSGNVMQHTVAGDMARLEKGGTDGYMADKDGDKAFNSKTGEFVDAKSAIDENGKIADGVAGKYLDANNKEVSAADALDENGKLKEGFSSQVATFSKLDANSDFAKDMAKQEANNGGVQLAYNDGKQKYQKYDANGKEDGNGSFVKVGDQLVSESAFKAGDNKQLDTYKSVSTDMSGGFQALATKDGKIQTFNEHGEEDANGKFVRSATQNDSGRYSFYEKSSFANDNGNISTFTNTGKTSSNDRLQATGSGTPMTFDRNGNASVDGNYYKRLSNDGTWDLVSKSNYQTDSSGATKTYSDQGNGYGRYVMSKDEAGKDQGYVKLANYSSHEPPKRYSYENGKYKESSNGEYVATVGHGGQTEYTRVMAAGTGAQTSGAVPTYDAKPMQMEVSNLDGSAASINTLSYQSAGSSGGGAYCQDAHGSYRELASGNVGYKDGGKSIQRYDRTDDGKYVESDTGRYAAVMDSSNPSAAPEYVELGSTDTFNANSSTSNGMPVDQSWTDDGRTFARVDSRNFDAEYRGEGMYAAEIGGQSYTLYDTSVWDKSTNMNDQNTQILSMNGRSFYAVSNVDGFDVKENQRPNRTYFGRTSADFASRYDLPAMNEKANDKNRIPVDFTNKDLAVCETNQGKAFFNSKAERTYVPGKNGQPGHYETEAYFVTNTKPDGDKGSYQTIIDKNTGNVAYGMKTKIRYDAKIGGHATLTFGKAIRDGNNSKRGSVVARAKKGIDPIIKRTKMKSPTQTMRGK